MRQEKECSVEIKRLSKKGYGVGKSPLFSKEIEVPKVFIGEKVLARVFKSKQGVHQGDLISIETTHPLRVSPRCIHAQSCGGCSWQQLDYTEQLKLKEQKVAQLFIDLCHPSKISPIISIDSPWSFRNKMEFTFYQTKEGMKSLGLIQTASKGRVIDVERCELCPSWMSQALGAVKSWWKHTEIDAYHRLRHTGMLHLLTLREGFNTEEKMVILTVCGQPSPSFSFDELEGFKRALLECIPDLTSIFLVIKHIQEGSPTSSNEMLLYGKDHIEEKMSLTIPSGENKELVFKISPSSFFQPCTKQAEKLLSIACRLCGKEPLGKVLDLYCGTATFGMLFSFHAKEVIGIELNPYAVFDAEVNIEKNKIHNLKVIQSDVKDFIKHIDPKDKIDLVIIDPPRAGLGPKAVEDVLSCCADKILYVSCNPLTQLEDVKLFVHQGYHIEAICPLDQFAHTPHLENVVLLKKLPLSSSCQ